MNRTSGAVGRGRPKKQPVETTGRKMTGRSGGRLRQLMAGVRRSPRAHAPTMMLATSNDEEEDTDVETGPEMVVNAASDVDSGPETVVNATSDVTEDTELHRDVLSSMLARDESVMRDERCDEDGAGSDGGTDGTDDGGRDDDERGSGNASGGEDDVADAGDADDAERDVGDADALVDVIEDDSTTRSLSMSLSPYEPAQPADVAHSAENDTARWSCDVADTIHNSMLFDADTANSMSSESDSVDVVSSLAVDDFSTTHDTSPMLVLGLSESNETRLQDLEDFVGRTGRGLELSEDMRSVDGRKNTSSTAGPSQSCPQLNESMSGQQAVSTHTTQLTHTADVRRGAMWRDSLFPSDFPPEPTSSCVSSAVETVAGKSMSAGKPSIDRGNKMSALEPLSVDWEIGRQHIDVLSGLRADNQSLDVLTGHRSDNESPRCAAATCRQNVPPMSLSSPHYHYKSLDVPATYNSGRRSVTDEYSQGLMYDGTTQQQRAASVRPTAAAAAAADAHRLSHMWTGAPLPAHQHHVSLSHLQYAPAPPPPLSASPSSSSSLPHNSVDFVRPCHQPQQPQRQHGSRQQHKAHHKQTSSSSSVTANQPAHGPPASLTAAAAAGYDMFSACRGIQQPISYFPHQGAAAALPMGVVGLHHAQMAVAAAANFAQPMPAGQAANSAMYSAAAAAAYNYLNGGGLQPFNVDINSVMRR